MTGYRSILAANDNAMGVEEGPRVPISAARVQAYLRRGNLIMPLSFAIRMLGWKPERLELTGGSKRG